MKNSQITVYKNFTAYLPVDDIGIVQAMIYYHAGLAKLELLNI